MKLKMNAVFLTLMFILLAFSMNTSAQNKKVNVSFKTGTNGASYAGTVTGSRSVDYYIKAKAGQQMSAKLTSANTSLYFLVTKEGEAQSIADDARDTTEWSGALPDDAAYVVRVFLFRNAARTNKRPVGFKIRFDIK